LRPLLILLLQALDCRHQALGKKALLRRQKFLLHHALLRCRACGRVGRPLLIRQSQVVGNLFQMHGNSGRIVDAGMPQFDLIAQYAAHDLIQLAQRNQTIIIDCPKDVIIGFQSKQCHAASDNQQQCQTPHGKIQACFDGQIFHAHLLFFYNSPAAFIDQAQQST
jgi:hypothetical protein